MSLRSVLIFFSMMFLTSHLLQAQDTIVTKTGIKIICKIERESVAKVVYNVTGINNAVYRTSIPRSDVAFITYADQQEADKNREQMLVHDDDILLLNNGRKMKVKIIYEDSSKVDFTVDRNGRKVTTYLSRADIESITYGNHEVKGVYLGNAAIGFGVGMDYGGFGTNLTLYPQRNFGIFFGIGYPLVQPTLTGGVKVRIAPSESSSVVVPFLLGMYGYNTAVIIKDNKSLSKLFFGPTFGFGVDLHLTEPHRGAFSLGLLVPIRKGEVDQYINNLKQNNNVKFENELSPVTFTIGYKIVIE